MRFTFDLSSIHQAVRDAATVGDLRRLQQVYTDYGVDLNCVPRLWIETTSETVLEWLHRHGLELNDEDGLVLLAADTDNVRWLLNKGMSPLNAITAVQQRKTSSPLTAMISHRLNTNLDLFKQHKILWLRKLKGLLQESPHVTPHTAALIIRFLD